MMIKGTVFLKVFMFTILSVATSSIHAALVSSFDTGLEGWTGTGGAVSHISSGGNPGGFLQQFDTDGTWMTVHAPSMFLGDLSSFLGGMISFDAANIGGTPVDLASIPWFGTVTITGAGATASFEVAGSGTGRPPNDSAWHTYSATFDPTLWSGDLETALGNVTEFSIVLEFGNTVTETAGFDNFQVAPVPLPGALALFFSGVAFLGLYQFRRTPEA